MTGHGEGLPRHGYYRDDTVTLLLGDAHDVLASLPDESVDCVVTSPPYYGLRDYGAEGQYGLEETPAAYVEQMRRVFAEARRVLSTDGTLWMNLGDSYSGSWGNQSRTSASPGKIVGDDGRYPDAGSRTGAQKTGEPPAKNLFGIPWRVAFALQDDGWILRNEIIWHKTNAMPESVRDRLSTRHETLFLFSKSQRYTFDLDAIREPHSAPQRKSGARAFRARNLNHPRTGTGSYEGPTATGYAPSVGEHVFCYRPSDGETRCGFVDDNQMGLFLSSCHDGRRVLTAARWNVQPMTPLTSCRTEGER